MAAKRKPDAAPDAVQELAAPAVLKRLQMDAAKFSAQIDDAEARLAALGELSPNAAETKDNREQIARVECELITARDNFGKTAKILLAYDRGVATERKDGPSPGRLAPWGERSPAPLVDADCAMAAISAKWPIGNSPNPPDLRMDHRSADARG